MNWNKIKQISLSYDFNSLNYDFAAAGSSLCYEDYDIGERQIRDFIDLDTTFRSVNGEQEEFDGGIPIKDEQIFNNNNDVDDQVDEEEKTNEEDQEDFDSESPDDNNELSDLSILEKEENLKPHITSNLEKFSKLFKK